MKKRTVLKALFAAAFVCAAVAFAEGPTTIKGNPGSKVYHKSTCKHYAAKGCTAEFAAEKAAVDAGYKPCKQCAVPKADKKTEKKTKKASEGESAAAE